ncbi:MAG: hypothetical protein ACFE9Q_04300 [Candidatus Hodarchaeota archaeon]
MRSDSKIPNWYIHNKWAKKAGIKNNIAYLINKALDYGFEWAIHHQDDIRLEDNDEGIIFQQLKYFYEKDSNKKGYIKALYLHHLLDFFKETHVNIYDIDLVFEKFLKNKVIVEINDLDGEKVNFQEEINEIFDLIRKNKDKLFKDLKL